MTSTNTMPDLSNPFPGLRCFLAEEDYLFFGRHEQIEDLVRRLRTNRLVAVVGTSGSGKSSLVRAGLLPAVLGGGMAQAGSAWDIAVMRPGGSPLAHLARALCEAGLYDADAEDALFHLQATLSRSRNGLLEAVRQSPAAAGSSLLLVVDQFEELFRFNRASAMSQEEAIAFVNLLQHATQQADQNVYVVLTMRSDFLGECSQFLGLAEAVNDGEFLIPRMTRDQIQQAIEGPIRVRGAPSPHACSSACSTTSRTARTSCPCCNTPSCAPGTCGNAANPTPQRPSTWSTTRPPAACTRPCHSTPTRSSRPSRPTSTARRRHASSRRSPNAVRTDVASAAPPAWTTWWPLPPWTSPSCIR